MGRDVSYQVVSTGRSFRVFDSAERKSYALIIPRPLRPHCPTAAPLTSDDRILPLEAMLLNALHCAFEPSDDRFLARGEETAKR